MKHQPLNQRVEALKQEVVQEQFVFNKHTHTSYEPRIVVERIKANEPSITLYMPQQKFLEVPLLPKELLLYQLQSKVFLNELGLQLVRAVDKQHLHNKYFREDVQAIQQTIKYINEHAPEQIPRYKQEIAWLQQTLDERVLAHRLLLSTVEHARDVIRAKKNSSTQQQLDEIYSEMAQETYNSFIDASDNATTINKLAQEYRLANNSGIDTLSTQATTSLQRIISAYEKHEHTWQ